MDIAFGVIGTVGVALHSARRVYELLSGIKGAPEAVNNVSKDVSALSNALDMLHKIVQSFKEPEQIKMLPMLQPPLENCVGTLHDIEIKIKPYVKMQAGKKSIWRGFTWTFREKDILVLQNTLLAHKQSLDIAISIADYSNNLSSSSENKENFQAVRRSIKNLNRKLDADRESVTNETYDGSEAGNSDYAYTMKQWLLRAETVFDEVVSDDPHELESLKLESDAEDESDNTRVGTDSNVDTDTKSHGMRLKTVTATNSSTGDQVGNVRSEVTSEQPDSGLLNPPVNLATHFRPVLSEKSSQKTNFHESGTKPGNSSQSKQHEKSVVDEGDGQQLGSQDVELKDMSNKSKDAENTSKSQAKTENDDSDSSIYQPLVTNDVNLAVQDFRRLSLGLPPDSEPFGNIFATQSSNLEKKPEKPEDTANGKEPALSRKAEKRKDTSNQISKLERSVTDLLISVKALLEGLTKWSKKEASEQEISDIYVKLGFNFNIACRAFMELGIKTSDLPAIPDRLRVLLEQTLILEPSPESLDVGLADIRQLIIDLLQGLKRKQRRARQIIDSRKANTSSAVAATDKARPYIALIGNPPGRETLDDKTEKENETGEASASDSTTPTVPSTTKLPDKPKEEIKVGDIVIAAHDFEKRSPDEIGFLKGERLRILETDEEFGDGWYLGYSFQRRESGLFPAVYTTKVSDLFSRPST